MPNPIKSISMAMLHSTNPEATITVTFPERFAAKPEDVIKALRQAEEDIESRGKKAMTTI